MRKTAFGLVVLCGLLLSATLLGFSADAVSPQNDDPAAPPPSSQRVVVVYKTPRLPTLSRNSIAEQADILDDARADLEAVIDHAENMELETAFDNLPAIVVNTDEAGLEALRADPNVESVFWDVPLRLFADYRSPFTAIGGNLGTPAYTDGTHQYTGSGYEVVVIDTGILSSHTAFGGKIVAEACFSEQGVLGNATFSSLCPSSATESTVTGAAEECTLSGCGHGTMVAGAAAMGRFNANGAYLTAGAAPQANLIPIKVVTRMDTTDSSEAYAYCGNISIRTCAVPFLSSILYGFNHVIELAKTRDRIAAVNLSMGTGAYLDRATCYSANTTYYPVFYNAINNLKSLGIATAIATGNSSLGNAGKIAFPACVEGAIAVNATSPFDDTIATYGQSGALTTLLAPGGMSTNNMTYMWLPSSSGANQFTNTTGTSFAAPTTAGAYAVLRSKYPSATVDQLTNLLTSTGKPISDTARNGTSSNPLIKPLIQVDAALSTATPSLPSDGNLYVKNGTSLRQFVTSSNYQFEYKIKSANPAIDFTSGYTPYTMSGRLLSSPDSEKLLPTGAGLQLISYALDGASVTRPYTIIVRGDINKDAKIDITDLVQLSQHMAGTKTLTGAPLLASDINKNANSDITDLVRISQHIAKVREINE
ncbi:MAG: S8 family serine peptidase [Candidatus Nomurabacteria bacterium]|jgi:subtilisin family serine protease|nr:S8 family serine peptidase [Candidatus Nomurabacteria bacterium]